MVILGLQVEYWLFQAGLLLLVHMLGGMTDALFLFVVPASSDIA